MTSGKRTTISDIKLNRIVRLVEFDASIRGKVIVMTIELEQIIDSIIANYFCDATKQNLFLSTVMKRVQLSEKVEMLKKILKSDYADIYKKIKRYFEGKEQKLVKIYQLRNRFAHSTLSFPELPSDDKSFQEAIILTTNENGKEIKYTFSKTDAKAKLDEIDRICGTLTDVLIMVRQKEGRF